MFITDPDQPVDTATPDPVDAAADAPDTTTDPLAAMDEGIAAATPTEPEPAPVADLPEGAEPPAAADAVDPPAGTEPAKPAAAAEPERPSAEFGELPKDAKVETRERFDKMRTAYDALHKEHAPLKAALEQAGVKDVAAFAATIPEVIQRAKDGEDLTRMVTDTGATPDQFSMTLDFLGLVNKGDPGSLDKAIDLVQTELQTLCKLRGRELPGVHDPLAEHEDLRAEVESGDLTRKRALEIVQTRTAESLAAARNQHESQRQQQTEAQQAAVAQAQEEARVALNDLGAELAKDPHYAAKFPALKDALATIKAEHPPHLWAAKAAIAYARIPNPKPAPAPNNPARPGPNVSNGLSPEFTDPMAAMEFGLRQVSQ